MNVRLFVSSVFAGCQRDLLARGGKAWQLFYSLPFVVLHSHSHKYISLYTHTRIRAGCSCLCSVPEIIAYFTEINRISISCTHTGWPRHLLAPLSFPLELRPEFPRLPLALVHIFTILMTLFLCWHKIFSYTRMRARFWGFVKGFVQQ